MTIDREILRSICDSKYSDWTDNDAAFDACKRLEAEGFCRVVWEDVKCWRVYQSSEQLALSLAAIAAPSTGDGA